MVDSNLHLHLMCSPKMNYKKDFADDGKITIKKDELIYVGEAIYIKKRYNMHLFGKLNKNNSMKFGLRKVFNNKVDFYYKEIINKKDRSKEEKGIRNQYGCWFGE